MDIAILDTSASAHMPDVLEMPYRPPLADAGLPNEKAHNYRLAGCTCLAGDVIGEYSFDNPLKAGDRLVFRGLSDCRADLPGPGPACFHRSHMDDDLLDKDVIRGFFEPGQEGVL